MLRTFTDPDGTVWRVWNVLPGNHGEYNPRTVNHLPAEFVGGWLCFESAAEKRRLSPVPASWEKGSDAELLALCRDAAAVRPMTRSLLAG